LMCGIDLRAPAPSRHDVRVDENAKRQPEEQLDR
jgi:hypothetical protein